MNINFIYGTFENRQQAQKHINTIAQRFKYNFVQLIEQPINESGRYGWVTY